LRRDEETKKEEMGEERKDGKSKGRDKRKRDWSKLRRELGTETEKDLGKLREEGRDKRNRNQENVKGNERQDKGDLGKLGGKEIERRKERKRKLGRGKLKRGRRQEECKRQEKRKGRKETRGEK
jgi:translation initiation factor 5B